MILAEKIMSLRKQNGWSQEELAEKLDISRQSVSKWESGTSIPDIEKIIKMSQLFGVSTDYLLKEKDDDAERISDISAYEESETIDTDGINNVRPISMEFASEYIDTVKNISKKFAAAVSTCIISPIALMILAAMSEVPGSGISEQVAAAIGITVLLCLVAAAVMVFILGGMKLSKYEFLEKEPIKLLYGVEAVITRKKEAYEPTFRMAIASGVILCILAAIPVVVAGAAQFTDVYFVGCVCVLLFVVSIAVFLFVSNGMVYGSYQKLLQIDDYDPEKKRINRRYEKIFGAYWCLVLAGYLAWSFITFKWEFTWIVWPVAGVLFAPFKMLIEAIGSKKDVQ